MGWIGTVVQNSPDILNNFLEFSCLFVCNFLLTYPGYLLDISQKPKSLPPQSTNSITSSILSMISLWCWWWCLPCWEWWSDLSEWWSDLSEWWSDLSEWWSDLSEWWSEKYKNIFIGDDVSHDEMVVWSIRVVIWKHWHLVYLLLYFWSIRMVVWSIKMVIWK